MPHADACHPRSTHCWVGPMRRTAPRVPNQCFATAPGRCPTLCRHDSVPELRPRMRCPNGDGHKARRCARCQWPGKARACLRLAQQSLRLLAIGTPRVMVSVVCRRLPVAMHRPHTVGGHRRNTVARHEARATFDGHAGPSVSWAGLWPQRRGKTPTTTITFAITMRCRTIARPCATS